MATATLILDLSQVEYTIECLEEDTPVRGNALASGDDDADREAEDEILAALERNPWAWCCVRVIARLGPFQGDDCLGCCSYKSEDDFLESGDYAPQMKDDALANLKAAIIAAGGTIVEPTLDETLAVAESILDEIGVD